MNTAAEKTQRLKAFVFDIVSHGKIDSVPVTFSIADELATALSNPPRRALRDVEPVETHIAQLGANHVETLSDCALIFTRTLHAKELLEKASSEPYPMLCKGALKRKTK